MINDSVCLHYGTDWDYFSIREMQERLSELEQIKAIHPIGQKDGLKFREFEVTIYEGKTNREYRIIEIYEDGTRN